MSLDVSLTRSHQTTALESLVVNCAIQGHRSITCAAIYHPPRDHGLFIEQWQPFCEELAAGNKDVLILGDFNLHINKPSDSSSKSFLQIASDLNVQVFDTGLTHEKGNQLDLILSRGLSVCDIFKFSFPWADHLALLFSVKEWLAANTPPLPSPKTAKQLTRCYRNITLSNFTTCLNQLRWSTPCPNSVDDHYSCFTSLIISALDTLAPLTLQNSKPCRKTRDDWFTPELKHLKNMGRILERRWRASPSNDNKEAWKVHQTLYKSSIIQAKQVFFNNLISQAKSSSNALFKIAKQYAAPPKLPCSNESAPSASELSQFFQDKVLKIRKTISHKQSVNKPSQPSTGEHLDTFSSLPSEGPPDPRSSWEFFQLVTPEQVLAAVNSLGNFTSMRDMMPTPLFKLLVPSFLDDLTALVNHSLAAGIFPAEAKWGTVIPLLKKPGSDTSTCANYRPITLLPLLARLLEKIVTAQLQSYLEVNNIFNDFQSGFRPARSTETAVTDIQQHLLRLRDKGHPAALILLDLSAAFDTIDHSLLLERMGAASGICGPVLAWFRSFLTNRGQQVCVGEDRAPPTSIKWGVPQGSALSPILFNIYMTPLASLIQRVGLHFQMYADDTQIVLDLHKSSRDSEVAPAALLRIQEWMEENWLCLNEGKTEILLTGLGDSGSGTPFEWPSAFGPPPIPVEKVRNLGVIFNSELNCVSQVDAVVSAGHHHLNCLRGVLPWLDVSNRAVLCQAVVLSRIMYCNSFFAGATAKSLGKLQKLQNRTIRAVKDLRWRDHVSEARADLNWLTIKDQVTLKLATIAWSIVHQQGPRYMQEWIGEDIQTETSKSLRSAYNNSMPVIKYSRERLGGRSMAVVLPRLWNSLPRHIRLCTSLRTFKFQVRQWLLN